MARYLIDGLERSGRLAAGSVVLEPSSGNTGISLAMICRTRGWPLTVVMPANVTRERRQVLEIYGATIIDSPADLGSNGAVAMARRMAADDPRYVMPDQYANPLNALAHYETTAVEILDDCPELDVFVAGLGTGGTLTGVGRRLRESRPAAKVYAAEPMPGEMVQGLRSLDDGFVPEVLGHFRPGRPFPGHDGRIDRGSASADSVGGHLRRRFLGRRAGRGVTHRRSDGIGHDRCAAGGRWLEVSVRGRLVA